MEEGEEDLDGNLESFIDDSVRYDTTSESESDENNRKKPKRKTEEEMISIYHRSLSSQASQLPDLFTKAKKSNKFLIFCFPLINSSLFK